MALIRRGSLHLVGTSIWTLLPPYLLCLLNRGIGLLGISSWLSTNRYRCLKLSKHKSSTLTNDVFNTAGKTLGNCVGSAKFPDIEYAFDSPVYCACWFVDLFYFVSHQPGLLRLSQSVCETIQSGYTSLMQRPDFEQRLASVSIIFVFIGCSASILSCKISLSYHLASIPTWAFLAFSISLLPSGDAGCHTGGRGGASSPITRMSGYT